MKFSVNLSPLFLKSRINLFGNGPKHPGYPWEIYHPPVPVRGKVGGLKKPLLGG